MKQLSKKMEISGRDIFFMLFGGALVALASKCIFDPANLVIGGVSGLAILVKWFGGLYFDVEIPLWVTTTAFNVPLMLMAWRANGFSFICRVLFATAAFSVWLAVIPEVPIVKDDILLATVFGAVISGAGIGLVFRAKATTGGTETVATLLWPHFKHLSLVQLLQIVDGTIVALGIVAFGVTNTLYAIMAVFIAARVSDSIVEGVKFAKQAFIVTNESERIADAVMTQLDRGITGLRAIGMYSKTDKTMLYCVVDKKEIVTLKEIVQEIDPSAFLVVGEAREVLGEGFLS